MPDNQGRPHGYAIRTVKSVKGWMSTRSARADTFSRQVGQRCQNNELYQGSSYVHVLLLLLFFTKSYLTDTQHFTLKEAQPILCLSFNMCGALSALVLLNAQLVFTPGLRANTKAAAGSSPRRVPRMFVRESRRLL
jgi:hypothetical protein